MSDRQGGGGRLEPAEQAVAAAQQLGADGMRAAAAPVQLPPASATSASAAAAAASTSAAAAAGVNNVNNDDAAPGRGAAGGDQALGWTQYENKSNRYENEGSMQPPPAQTPADGSRMQPPDSNQVFHSRNGIRGPPPPREIPYAGSEKGRYEKLQQIGVVAGEWKPEEDAALLALVNAEGPGAWTTKSETLGAATGYRSSTALRKRYNRLAGIEGPARPARRGEPQSIKRTVPPEFDQIGAMNGFCKGCVPRSKSKHTCGKQYSPATAARRYGEDYASREYGSDGKILQNSHGSPGTDSKLPSCAACQRERKHCVHKVDVMMPGVLRGLSLPQEEGINGTGRSLREAGKSFPKGECDFCRRREGGATLRTGCACRDSFYGFAGYIHMACLMKAAEKDEQIMYECPKCKQRWQGELAIELARYNRSRSAEGPKGARRPEDPECVRATVDLVATLCIAAVEDQNVE